MKKIVFLLSLVISFMYAENYIPIQKNGFLIMYSCLNKGPAGTKYTLKGNLVDNINIKKRPSFYTEKQLPKECQVSTNDYINTGKDRGHVSPDASFDYDQSLLLETYSMANITPQDPVVNRKIWVQIEEMERYSAKQFISVDITNIVVYEGSEKLRKKPGGKSIFEEQLIQKNISVPSGYFKKISNKEHSFSECYYVENKNQKIKNLNNYLIDCKVMDKYISYVFNGE